MPSKKTYRERIEENKMKIAKLQEEIRALEKKERQMQKREEAKNLSELGRLYKAATGKTFSKEDEAEVLRVLKGHFGKEESPVTEKIPPDIDD